jgi:2-aminoadipate transaminase
LITTGSQQGLDLVAKILAEVGCKILVESPTYLGAVMTFTPMELAVISVAIDDGGIDLADYKDPTGRTMSQARQTRAKPASGATRLSLSLFAGQVAGTITLIKTRSQPKTRP